MIQEILINAYIPLIAWSVLGFLGSRWIPDNIPRILGRSLFWVGIPVEVLALARRTHFDNHPELAVLMNGIVLILGMILAWLGWKILNTWTFSLIESVSFQTSNKLGKATPLNSLQGGFFLATLLGNTNFVGLVIAPYLVPEATLSLAICYSVSNNLLGSYGLGVWVASYLGHSSVEINGWTHFKRVLTVPSLWAFGLGYTTRNIAFPMVIEWLLQNSLTVIIPMAILLIGIRLGKIKGAKSWTVALLPAILKVVMIPAIVGGLGIVLNLDRDILLVLVLMSGMPTALASLILAEEYDLEQSILAGSIVISSVLILLMLPLWLWLFGASLSKCRLG
jgi:hypothetical protein